MRAALSGPCAAVLFDLDDTLVTLAEALPRAWAATRQVCVDATGMNPDRYEAVSLEVRRQLFADLAAGKATGRT